MSSVVESTKDRVSGLGFDSFSSKRVTYIIPTKNRAAQLSDSLDAARQYMTSMDELIVVDGLSDDDTRSVVSRNSDIVDKFISEPDKNAAHAVNKGLLLASGRYIRANADDDVLHPAAMEQAIRVLDQHPEVDVIVCGGTKQYTGEPSFEIWLPPGVNYGKSTEDVFRYKGSGSGFVIRRSALSLIGLIPATIAADLEFLLRAIDRGANVKFCRIDLYQHFIHSDSYTIKYEKEFLKDSYRMLRQYCSLRFFIYIRVQWFLRGHQRWKKFAELAVAAIKLPLRAWNKGLRVLGLKRANMAENGGSGPQQIEKWDGGFS